MAKKARSKVAAHSPPATPARARDTRLGPRDRLRAQLAELTGTNLELTPEDVPVLESRIARTKWIYQLIRTNRWMTAHTRVIAEAWMCTPGAVKEYAHAAATALEVAEGKSEQMAHDAAGRLVLRGQFAENESVAQRADEIILALTGHLKGGAEQPSMTTAEREQAIVASIKDPDETMERLLREAFGDPGERLRGLLVEFATVTATGETRS